MKMSYEVREKILTFRPDTDVFRAMTALRDRDGVPFAEQIRRGLRLYLEKRQLLEKQPKRRTGAR